MEFHENRARQPFIGFVLLVRFIKKWWLQEQTRRVLQQMSDEQLKDIGLRRDQIPDKYYFLLNNERKTRD